MEMLHALAMSVINTSMDESEELPLCS